MKNPSTTLENHQKKNDKMPRIALDTVEALGPAQKLICTGWMGWWGRFNLSEDFCGV